MELNNWLQANRVGTLEWEVNSTGPRHAQTWTAKAYVNRIEYGSADGRTQAIAKEEAARQALIGLKSQYKV